MRTTSRLDRQGSRPTNHARPSRRCAAGSESGFTIVELLVSAMITLAVIGVALSSFSSGQLLARFGWSTVNEVIFPAVFIAGAFLAWHMVRHRATTA